MMPKDGPQTRSVEWEAATKLTLSNEPAFPYALVDLSSNVVSYLRDIGPESFFRSFGMGKGGPATIRVGVGDAVQVTLFESSAGGLFISADNGARPGNYVTLPSQNVDQAGLITVPYAGEVMARGRTVVEIQREIQNKLSSRAIEPQAVVAITSQTSSQVSVIGQVGAPTRLSLNPAGEKIVDVLSRSGGIHNAGHETFVTLQRGQRKATVYFLNLISNPSENIYVQPSDVIYVYQEKRYFTALGATGQSGQYSFEQERLTLSDALGRAGGLLDTRADPKHVLVYRPEVRDRLESMGVDLAKFPKDAAIIPTIYRANLRDPAGFFLTQGFFVRNRDVLYVGNADQIEIVKFVSLVTTVTGGAATVASDALGIKTNIRALGQ